MKTSVKILIGCFVVATIAFAVIMLLVPSRLFAPGTYNVRLGIAMELAMFTLELGASWFFLSSLKNFKTGLRVAYVSLAVGIVLLGLFEVANVVAVFSPVALPAIAAVPILLSYLLSILGIYIGMRKFGRLLSIRNIWTSAWFVIIAAFIGAFIITLLPHPQLPHVSEAVFDAQFALITWITIVSLASLVVSVRIRKIVGQAYVPAMNWLVAALAVELFTNVHEPISKLLLPGTNWYIATGASGWPFLAFSILFVKAGQMFKQATIEEPKLSENATYLDGVMYVAQLASNPAAINPILDKVRGVTAFMKPGSELAADDKAKLLDAYGEVEVYLTTKEPLRKFSEADLRSRLTYDFQQAIKAHQKAGRETGRPRNDSENGPTAAATV
ncbi:MAG TPA: hypothetical protein VLI05_07350 [Candidatus Saccharimonadia bacterium]|nr:hypothetical protein [Candidatus Saccharimonadia bacterium]